MMRGFKIRLLPNEEQEKFLFNIANGSRFVWNWALEYQINRFNNKQKIVQSNDLRKELIKYTHTEDGKWLLDLPQKYLYEVFRDLYKAYTRFFKIQKEGIMFSKQTIIKRKRQNKSLTPYDMKGHPKFKKKKYAKLSFNSGNEATYFKINKNNELCVHIQKIGFIKIQTDFKLPIGRGKKTIYNPRVIYENDKWTINFVLECDNQAKPELKDYIIGIDLGINSLAIATHCDQNNTQTKKFKNINKTNKVKKLKKRLKHFERKLSTCFVKNNSYESTKGTEKIRKKLNKIYKKLTCIRKNYIHHVTREIINNLPYAIVLEDLNIKGMMKNHHIAKALAEQMLFEVRRQLEYKAENYGISVIIAPWNFPSSKKCSNCGNIKKDLKLGNSIYICKQCGIKIDRDINAANNLEEYGKIMFNIHSL